MSIGIWQLVLILAIILIIFGGGKIPRLLGDFVKVLKILKKKLNQIIKKSQKINKIFCRHSSVVERLIGNEEVTGSIPVGGTISKVRSRFSDNYC